LTLSSVTGFAQDTTDDSEGIELKKLEGLSKEINKTVNKEVYKNLNKELKYTLKDLNKSLVYLNKDLNKSLKTELKMLNKDLNLDLNTEINTELNSGIGARVNNMVSENTNKGSITEKVKNFSKSYPLDANDRVSIDNKFGKVVVKTWAKAEVKVDVEIRSYADDNETAQKLIDAVSISDSKDGDQASFRTVFGNGKENSMWGLFNNRNDHHKVEVNYSVYMPTKNALEINNKYGATEVPDFEGKVDIENAYGSLQAGSLNHPGNHIHVKYGSANIESLSNADVEMGYGSLELGAADKLNGDFKYGSVRIGKLKGSANIDARYAGTVSIGSVDKNFSNISVNCTYSGVKLGLDNTSNADFDITVRYGGFESGSVPVEITQKTPSDNERGFRPTHNYKGRVGKGSAERTINISSSYGSVTFE